VVLILGNREKSAGAKNMVDGIQRTSDVSEHASYLPLPWKPFRRTFHSITDVHKSFILRIYKIALFSIMA
jgi:hypothetical protein